MIRQYATGKKPASAWVSALVDIISGMSAGQKKRRRTMEKEYAINTNGQKRTQHEQEK